MKMSKYLAQKTKSEIEYLRSELNLTDDEQKIFDLLSKGKSKQEIAMKCLVSVSTVTNRIADIRHKLERIDKD